MTQVSKRYMRGQLEQKVDQTFWETVVKMDKHQDASLFFSDLFTKAERINFVKRLSIAVLLYKGHDWRQISDLLKVSTTTIAKVAAKMGNNGFKVFFRRIEKDKSWSEFWKELGKLYITITHPEKYAKLGDEGVEAIYFPNKKKSLF